MKKKEFKIWLEKSEKNYESTTISSRLSNIQTIEDIYGDIDRLMSKNKYPSILEEFNYSSEDEREQRPPCHKIPIDGNIREGSATYKQALKLYQQFYQEYNSSTAFKRESWKLEAKMKDFKSHLLKKKSLKQEEIKNLQEVLLTYLKESFPNINWKSEEKCNHNKIKDRIDICGYINDTHYIVIELDPLRADSISKKFISRNALYIDKNLIYISACYPNKNNVKNTNECNKYFSYCNTITEKLFKSSLEKYYINVKLGD